VGVGHRALVLGGDLGAAGYDFCHTFHGSIVEPGADCSKRLPQERKDGGTIANFIFARQTWSANPMGERTASFLRSLRLTVTCLWVRSNVK
jgi:hypothetical protein